MEPFTTNVAIIQYLLLLLILPPDSNVESSNMGQPRIGFGYLNLDTAETGNVPGRLSCSQQRAQPIPEHRSIMQRLWPNRVKPVRKIAKSGRVLRPEGPRTCPCWRAIAGMQPAWERQWRWTNT